MPTAFISSMLIYMGSGAALFTGISDSALEGLYIRIAICTAEELPHDGTRYAAEPLLTATASSPPLPLPLKDARRAMLSPHFD